MHLTEGSLGRCSLLSHDLLMHLEIKIKEELRRYDLINQHNAEILATISPAHVADYDWLRANLHLAETHDYQQRYRTYWGMKTAHLSYSFCDAYFNILHRHLDKTPDLGDVMIELYKIPTHRNGRRSLQFSFATKLLHTINNNTPIYDSRVAQFYSLKKSKWKPIKHRIADFVEFYQFLQTEYRRIIALDLLGPSILAFRHTFHPQYFTDEKVIDSLIWGYIQSGGIINGPVYCSHSSTFLR